MEHVSRSTKPVPSERPPASAGETAPTGAAASSATAPKAVSAARGRGASSTWWGGPQRADRPADRLSGLAQALVGDAVLQHVAGRRVLDLGHGSPEIAQWVRPIAASLDTVDLQLCTTDAGEIRLPQADARYDVVYSLRTLAHLGHDEVSSDLGVRTLLAEAARVTVPGGVILVDINNPRSLRGLFYGIRRPITLVAAGKVVHADERHHVTRYDTLARLLRVAPAVLDTIAVYGVRVLVPLGRALRIPGLGRLLAAWEWWARDSFLRGFGAHLLVVLRKDEDAARADSPSK
jgi:SAM-dependent methyltransferase